MGHVVASDVLWAQDIIFGLIALAMAVSAIRVVTTKNIVHAALYLVVVLAGVAGLYILLAAEFIAVVQVLVYIGAIIGLFVFGVLAYVLQDAFGTTKLHDTSVQGTALVGNAIFQTYVIPFEVISVLLLAALVGAVVIARRD